MAGDIASYAAGVLVDQQDSFGGPTQEACVQVLWQSGGHTHV